MSTLPEIKNEAEELRLKQQRDNITRIVAIVVAFLGTFFFFIKLLFL